MLNALHQCCGSVFDPKTQRLAGELFSLRVLHDLSDAHCHASTANKHHAGASRSSGVPRSCRTLLARLDGPTNRSRKNSAFHCTSRSSKSMPPEGVGELMARHVSHGERALAWRPGACRVDRLAQGKKVTVAFDSTAGSATVRRATTG